MPPLWRLQGSLLPWAPDREGQPAARLDVDEQHLAVGREGRAGELVALAARDDVAGEVEDLARRRDAPEEVLDRPVLAQQRRLLGADAEVVGELEHRAARGLEQQRQLLPVGVVDPQLAEAVAVARRGGLARRQVAALRRHEVDLARVVEDALEAAEERRALG